MESELETSQTIKSLDQIDLESYGAGNSPIQSPVEMVNLLREAAAQPVGRSIMSLDGEWQMAEEGSPDQRLGGEWDDAIPATVPGSVHTALWKAGKISDPYLGRNDALAREKSFKTWWFKRSFRKPQGFSDERLTFDGVAVHCTVWLNGTQLGEHEGMFGGPSYAVQGLLQEENTLIVKIDPAPYLEGPGPLNDFFQNMNVGWTKTVVFNNVYGWHYSNIPSLGLWRSVRVEGTPPISLGNPFITTRDAARGQVEINLELIGRQAGFSGRLVGTIEPENFTGECYSFERQVQSAGLKENLHLGLEIPNPRLWWPNGKGQPNLYRVRLAIAPDGGGEWDAREISLGIRTLQMAPLPGGPYPDKYNWTFVVNGIPMFIKGTGWCSMDPLMDFSHQRYDRLLSLAKDQHIMMLRCWGSGMPETDEFYDLCDRYGILVMQEWPTAWNSHMVQPFDVLEETVRLNTVRLRNHPSLVMWGGGNESSQPFGASIDMMGRLSVELDGTRPFHRGEPWGGSLHDYTSDWGRKPLDTNLHLRADFFGEFGMNSVPGYESVQRYLPEDEKDLWPAPDGKSFAYHTPVFNTKGCMERLRQFSGYFSAGETMQAFIFGSQLAAATCTRHTLELARTRWPACSGALYYKMNDNYPAASWACVDWFGAPKMTHFFNMDAFEPLAAVIRFDAFQNVDKPLDLAVWLLDDNDDLKHRAWRLLVRVYDHTLTQVAEKSFSGSNSPGPVSYQGMLALTSRQTHSSPLLVTSEVLVEGILVFRTFYWLNFEAQKDCLLTLPQTSLQLTVTGEHTIQVKNNGDLPAVGINIQQPGQADTFRISDNYTWLNPGETRTFEVNNTAGLVASAWNAAQSTPQQA